MGAISDPCEPEATKVFFKNEGRIKLKPGDVSITMPIKNVSWTLRDPTSGRILTHHNATPLKECSLKDIVDELEHRAKTAVATLDGSGMVSHVDGVYLGGMCKILGTLLYFPEKIMRLSDKDLEVAVVLRKRS